MTRPDQPLSPQEIDAIASRPVHRVICVDHSEGCFYDHHQVVPLVVEERDGLVKMAHDRDAAQSAIRAFLAQWDSPGGFVMADDADELAALRAIVAEPTA